MPWLNVTNEQAALLRRVLDQFPQTAGNPRIRQDTERSYDDRQDFQAPEVYIALVPPGGIAGLSRTGTGNPGEGDMPGSADCDIHRIIGGSLFPIAGLTRTVYNLSENPIAEGWVQVSRDKFGSWIAGVPSSGSECFEIMDDLIGEGPEYLNGLEPVPDTGTPLNCLIRVKVGCGIKINDDGGVSVNLEELIGTLGPDLAAGDSTGTGEDCGLQTVGYTGFVSTVTSIDSITIEDDCSITINLSYQTFEFERGLLKSVFAGTGTG